MPQFADGVAIGGLQNFMAGPNGTLIPDVRTYGGEAAAVASGQMSATTAAQSSAAIAALNSSTASSGSVHVPGPNVGQLTGQLQIGVAEKAAEMSGTFTSILSDRNLQIIGVGLALLGLLLYRGSN